METDHWADLELRHLKSFRAIAATGSFHAAADLLDYTQSAVSQHLAALESIVGVRLVERSRGHRLVEVTEPGRLLLRHADAIVARLSAAQADLRSYAEGASGVLRVGTYQSVGARILPALVSRFSQTWPGVEVRLREDHEDVLLLAFVESGEIDLAFTVFPLPSGPFDAVELLRDPYVLMVAIDSPLAGHTGAPVLREIANQPLIGFRGSRTTELAEAYLRSNGVEPKVVFRSNDNGTVQGLVAAGVGSALVPLLTVDADDPAVTLLPADVPPRIIGLAWHRDRHRSPANRAFVELAREVCSAVRVEIPEGRTDAAGVA
ncbi:MAG: LysR family transcriptional regulator [Candidatus Limnocylindrales bacterium]